MANISTQQARQRFQKISAPLQDAIFSVQTSEIVRQVCEQNNISEDKMLAVGKVVGLVLLGFIYPADFATEISGIPEMQPDVVGQIASAIDTKIFAPLKPELESIYKPPKGAPTSTPPQPQAQQPQIPPMSPAAVTPKLTSEQNILIKPSINETPFILHKEEELKLHTETVPVNNSPLRPMFYKAPTASPQAEERVLESRPIAARLELGVETQPVVESAPKMSRTPREEIRQVNYSEFRTPLNNPFAGMPRPKENEQKPVSEPAAGTNNKNESVKKLTVPDTNIVNLKDLPL